MRAARDRGGRALGAELGQLEREHRAEAAHVGARRRDPLEAGADVSPISSARGSSPGSTSRTAFAAAHAAGFPPKVPPSPPSGGVHQLGPAGDRRERKPAAERLAGDEQVGLDTS